MNLNGVYRKEPILAILYDKGDVCASYGFSLDL